MTLVEPPADRALNFGQHYAVLNLDLMSCLINAIKDTAAGEAFVSNFSRWNDAVHQKKPSAAYDLYKTRLQSFAA